ncbi:MAG TPA: sigma-70 family RNA polymerase sigma factor [Thermoanaerobaculia bacterium]|nr:sigma-70 family RNA polymerase sigma factor [Thermoanaerobaculia bacterium]
MPLRAQSRIRAAAAAAEPPRRDGPISGRSDAELAISAREGSEAAFRELVERFERPVFSLIVRMVRDRSLAEDLTQETFVKAYRNLAAYDAERKLSSWLFKIAHNATIDHLRRREVETVPLDASPDDEERPGLDRRLADRTARGPDLAVGRGELARALEAAVAELRPEYREVVLMRFAEDLSYQEIALATGLPLGTVKTHLHRARKELVAALAARGFGAEGLGG